MHLAASHGPEWWTVCDRIVPAAGARVVELVDALDLDDHHGDLCAECHRMIVFAGTVAGDRVARLVASLERAA